MPTYHWTCHVCKASNAPGISICQACGFPAVASGRDIEAATTGKKIETLLTKKELKRARREELAALSNWKKPIAVALWGIQFIGALTCWLTLSLPGIATGIALIVVAEVSYQALVGEFRGRQIRQ